MPTRDDDRHPLDPDEYPDADESSDDLIACPHCRAAIFADTERCPTCGQYLSREDAGDDRHPWWIIVGVLICLAISIWWIWPG